MSERVHDTDGHTRTVLRVRCRECDDLTTTTQLEHGPETPQTRAVERAHQTLADEHTAETGHDTTVELEGKRAT